VLPYGYRLRQGSAIDRSLLVKFMQRTYSEMATAQMGSHWAQTVDDYLSASTPLWWVELEPGATVAEDAAGDAVQGGGALGLFASAVRSPIAGLWLGNAVDQVTGDRHAHVFLLYVDPAHRRRGIGTALMHQAETWARQRGDRQIGLQVFTTNQSALALYTQLGFAPQSVWMVKPLEPGE
jgi:GNAT superfamily N-acetyltransferase